MVDVWWVFWHARAAINGHEDIGVGARSMGMGCVFIGGLAASFLDSRIEGPNWRFERLDM